MNAADFHQAWPCLLDSKPISNQQATSLHQHLNEDQALTSTLIDDLAVHRILRSLHPTESKEESDSFVNDCLRQIRESESPVLVAPVINTGSASKVEISQRVKKATQKRQRNAKWLVGLLSVAAAILVGCFVIVMQNNSDTQNTTQHDLNATQPEGEPAAQEKVDTQVELVEADNEPIDRSVPEEPVDDLPSLPKLDEVEQLAESTDDVPLENGANKLNNAIALIEFNDETVWAEDSITPEPGPIELGRYELTRGLVVVQLPEQQVLITNGPADFELLGDDKIALHSGEFQIESLANLSPLEIDTRDLMIDQLNNARIQLRIDEDGSEVLLAAGTINLTRKLDADEPAMGMKLNELNRAFVNNPRALQGTKKSMPAIIATGPKKYFAQVGIGEQKKSSSTRGGFKAILDQHAQESTQPINDLQRFHQMFDDLRQQFNDPGAGTDTPPGFTLQSDFQNGDGKTEIEELRGRLKVITDK